jgi:hypothetical protein
MDIMKTILLISFFFLGCNNQNVTGPSIKKIKNARGELSILPYIIVKGDTLLNGKASYYNSEGKIKEELDYKYGSKEGWDTKFDSLQELTSKIFYKNNLPNGYGYFYDDSKKVVSKRYFIDGVKVLELRMTSNTKPIQYQVFDDMGGVQYVVLFDSTGKKVYENGYIFQDSIYYVRPQKDSINVNAPVEIKLFLTQLPKYTDKIRFDLFDRHGRRHNIKSDIISDSFFASIKFVPTDAGENTIAIFGELTDDAGKVVKRDTLVEKFEVRK